MLKQLDESVELIENYLADQKFMKANEYLQSLFPEDIARISRHIEKDFLLPFINVVQLFPTIPDIVKEMEMSIIIKLIRAQTPLQIESLFARLDPDDIASIISSLPEDLETLVYENMNKEDTEETETLLQFKEEEAGRIMSVDYFFMTENSTVMEAFKALKLAHDLEMIYYIYIVDSRDHLIGVCSLRDLLTKPNNATMKDIMKSMVISVPGRMDQEDVARIVEKYNLAAVPVVNSINQLIGIITVDDVIDIIRSEATEDIMKLAGTTEEEFGVQSPFKGFLRRMPWLLVSFFGGMLTIQTNIHFLGKISQTEMWAFVTIIAGMGGNIASQSSTIVVRGLATGRILTTELWEVLFKEISIGVLLGLFFGILLGITATLQFNHISAIGVSVALGMLISMLIAATVGSLMPIVFQRINVDPAVATGPFVSTTIDNLGLVGYFTSTIIILRYLT
ncbi:MAG: magnesium transporter [Proteobacteria bacterium]|nr:magnesium transporter [Pseudomonadota bacterium]